MLKFPNVQFIPEKDSASVFIKVQAYPNYFGLRDRDYLSDNEIQRICAKHKNYIILRYYCFENYLFHPKNIDELNILGFDHDQYSKEILRQKNLQLKDIIIDLKSTRNSYQEFKIKENSFRGNEKEIIENLESQK